MRTYPISIIHCVSTSTYDRYYLLQCTGYQASVKVSPWKPEGIRCRRNVTSLHPPITRQSRPHRSVNIVTQKMCFQYFLEVTATKSLTACSRFYLYFDLILKEDSHDGRLKFSSFISRIFRAVTQEIFCICNGAMQCNDHQWGQAYKTYVGRFLLCTHPLSCKSSLPGAPAPSCWAPWRCSPPPRTGRPPASPRTGT